MLIMASALSIQSPFLSFLQCDPDTITRRRPMMSTHGDPFTLLNLFDEWIYVSGLLAFQDCTLLLSGFRSNQTGRTRAHGANDEVSRSNVCMTSPNCVVSFKRSSAYVHADFSACISKLAYAQDYNLEIDYRQAKTRTTLEKREHWRKKQQLKDLRSEHDKESKQRKVLKLEVGTTMCSTVHVLFSIRNLRSVVR